MQELQKRIGYHFTNEELLTLALSHPSTNQDKNNQRLEFLGDAILGAIVAHILYEMYPEEQEGQLARRHAALVRGETLTSLARDLSIGDALTFGLSEIQADGHDKDSNLEDALESLIGAMYLDGGMQAAEAFIRPLWTKLAQQVTNAPKDAKTSLQEWAQARGLDIPSYEVIEMTGPAHAPLFTISVAITGYEAAQAKGNSKRAAEQNAAKTLLQRLPDDK